MPLQSLIDKNIIEGFKNGDADIIRECFYGYCEIGYNLFDKRYQLSEKENLDFMSLAHQYAIYLMEHNWKPLEDRSANVSLKTWFINGFRFVVLDALKWYRKEYGSITFEDYLQSFEITSDLRLQFNKMVEDLCDHAPLTRYDRLIINLLLLQGYKGKEVAVQLGMTPSAVSQRYKKLKEQIIARTTGLCTEMEGAAIAQTAYRNQIPFVILRAISDKADDSAEMDYPTFERIAAHRCADVTKAMARMLKEK